MAKDMTKKPHGKKSKADDDTPVGPLPAPRLKGVYEEKVRKALAEQFGLANPMQQPRLRSIVINVNMGRHLEGTKLPPNVKATVLDTITKISGQKPVVLKAKKSVSNFKVREGYETAAMVTSAASACGTSSIASSISPRRVSKTSAASTTAVSTARATTPWACRSRACSPRSTWPR